MRELREAINRELQQGILRKAQLTNVAGWQKGKAVNLTRLTFEPKMEIKREGFRAMAEKHHLPSVDLRTRVYALLGQPKRGTLVKIEVHVDSDGQRILVTNLAEKGSGEVHEKDRRKIVRFLKAILAKGQE